MKKILFVCTGNTCRSPMAEALYNRITGGENAFSAGLQVLHPSGAADNAQKAAARYGADLSGHVSREISLGDIEKAEKIITMTSSQKEYLKRAAPGCTVMTLSEFAGKAEDVTDPFGGSQEVYDSCAAQIYRYIKEGLLRSCVRHAVPEDGASIAELESRCFSDAWSENSVLNAIESRRVLVFEKNGVISGYCIYMTAADEGEVLRIAVKKEERGKGIGRALLDSALLQMKKAGAQKAYLEVRESNCAAAALYTAAGFVNTDLRKNYYGDNKENALIFSKDLN